MRVLVIPDVHLKPRMFRDAETVMARENPEYRVVQSDSALSLPDGKPLSVVGKRKTDVPMEKVTGTHFMQNTFTDPRFAGKRHFFYGTKEETLKQIISSSVM